jgi:hypothetical protein
LAAGLILRRGSEGNKVKKAKERQEENEKARVKGWKIENDCERGEWKRLICEFKY